MFKSIAVPRRNVNPSREALVGTPKKRRSFKELLPAIPNVGEDRDFNTFQRKVAKTQRREDSRTSLRLCVSASLR
jgi:hypothetical protein